MLDSAERMSYITEYISAYEAKIKLSNKNGLFDAAKLFEVFAVEVCRIWFGQQFNDLNEIKPNYPYVDLLSNDKEIFVQVSTVQDTPSKIKNTLEDIKNGKKEVVEKIKNVYFFFMHNESIADVKDYTGDTKIGTIEFEQEKHLITTQKIVSRSISDLNFQKALYNLLISENKRIIELSDQLTEEFKKSKTIGLDGIESLINNEYEIDRTEIVAQIKASATQFVSVRGEAGSGKSVICKKVVQDEPYLLFARAERFVEETDINDIWHLNVSDALAYLNKKKLVFFIDSLEFIADASKTKIELLQSLYHLVSKHPNAEIINSCRSCDATAFLAIDSKYFIQPYVVDRLSLLELSKISSKYPIIASFMNDDKYTDLIKSPFYINLIVKNVADYSSVTDENKLRNMIWENVICLKLNTQKYGISFQDVVNEINKIAFERAKTFSVGISSDTVNQKVLNALISENVVIESNRTVRLKYDIFEDICFEQRIDKEFDACRGTYTVFFDNIEGFGRCCYRRYQIWISNKIFTKINRDKFLYNLFFAKNIPEKWIKQTFIGLVKSRFCTPFLEEQTDNIIALGRLQKLIDIINLYAFDAKVYYSKTEPYFSLHPKGSGRAAIIKVIFNNEIYKSLIIDLDSIIKLCSDYAKEEKHDIEVGKMTSLILSYYVDGILHDDKIPFYYKSKKVNPLLIPIYQLSVFSKDWIIEFWKKQKVEFLSDNHENARIAKEIFENTLDNTVLVLAKNLTSELCDLATLFWTANINSNRLFYSRGYDSVCYKYGLNEHADDYEHSKNSLHSGNFFSSLLRMNFWEGLNWAIRFINNAVDCFTKKSPKEITEIIIHFSNKNIEKRFFANPEMWLASSQEGYFPALLGDIVYILRNQIILIIKNAIHNGIEYREFALMIKETIYEKSNNITLFSIIEDIGIEFEKELPGFALDLATSMDILYWDINRYVILNPGREVKALETHIYTIVGLPGLKGRYEDGFAKRYTLQDYVCHMQLNSHCQEYCHKALDYLYSRYPNDKANALKHLQIQKMDLRTSVVEVVDQRTIAISPIISGEAKEIVESNKAHGSSDTNIKELISNFCNPVNFKNYNVDDINEKIDLLLSEMENVEVPSVYCEYLILMISCALSKEELDPSKREEYCEFWVNGVESIFENQSFIFDFGFLFVLFKQVNSNLSQKLKCRIKALVLKIVTYTGDNGLINKMCHVTKEYLKNNHTLADAIFNTIIALSSDEYQHQLFNYNYLVENDNKRSVEFIPNLTSKSVSVDRLLSCKGEKTYSSRHDELVEKYLFKEEILDLKDFDIKKHDISTLCSIVHCGICLEEEKQFLLKEMIIEILRIYNRNQSQYESSSVLNIMLEAQVIHYLGEALFENSHIILEIMFDEVDFSVFKQDTIDFYLQVFNAILSKYVDSYNDPKARKQCESILLELECKINKFVSDTGVKNQLYRALILSVNGYEGDWSIIKTGYTYGDIQFLNGMIEKYGKYNFKYLIHTLYKMHIQDLLPWILTSISSALQSFTTTEHFKQEDFNEVRVLLDNFVIVSFLNYHDEIKQDEELSAAFETILEILVEYRFEDAAVLLDEFRIH